MNRTRRPLVPDSESTLTDCLARVERAMPGSPEHLALQLRAGIHPPDHVFDRHLPAELRAHSGVHWTPLAVAVRAARWLESAGVRSVVDVGSGAGKFCVAAALAGTMKYLGLEQRPRLVTAARRLATVFRVEDRVEFQCALLGRDSVPVADAYYFYNPLGENLLGENLIDTEVELSEERFYRDRELLEDLLVNAADGTYVVTFHGLGGLMPSSYSEIRAERRSRGVLRLWRKDEASLADSP